MDLICNQLILIEQELVLASAAGYATNTHFAKQLLCALSL